MKTHEAAARAAMDQYASMNAPLTDWHLDERSPIQTDLFGAAEEILEVGGGGSSRTTEEEQPKAEARGSEDFLDCQEDDKGEESVPEIEREPTSGILFLVIVQLDLPDAPEHMPVQVELRVPGAACQDIWTSSAVQKRFDVGDGANQAIVPCGQNATFLLKPTCDRVEGNLSIVGQHVGKMCVVLSSLVEHHRNDCWYKFEGSKSSCRLALCVRHFPPLDEGKRRDFFGFIGSIKANVPSRLTRVPLTEPWSPGRGEVWYRQSGASLKRKTHAEKEPPLQYWTYLCGSLPEKVKSDIAKDVPRTFPDHSLFKDPTLLMLSLRNVLEAYARRNPNIGYCQGLNFIAGLLLCVVEEEVAFWLLASVVEDICPSYHSSNMGGLKIDLQAMEELGKDDLSKIQAHLAEIGADLSLVCLPWFLTLFSDSVPCAVVFRFWDMIFEVGSPAVLSLALAMLIELEPRILACEVISDVMTVLHKCPPAHQPKWEAVLARAHKQCNVAITYKTLQNARDHHYIKWRSENDDAEDTCVMERQPSRVLTATSPVHLVHMSTQVTPQPQPPPKSARRGVLSASTLLGGGAEKLLGSSGALLGGGYSIAQQQLEKGYAAAQQMILESKQELSFSDRPKRKKGVFTWRNLGESVPVNDENSNVPVQSQQLAENSNLPVQVQQPAKSYDFLTGSPMRGDKQTIKDSPIAEKTHVEFGQALLHASPTPASTKKKGRSPGAKARSGAASAETFDDSPEGTPAAVQGVLRVDAESREPLVVIEGGGVSGDDVSDEEEGEAESLSTYEDSTPLYAEDGKSSSVSGDSPHPDQDWPLPAVQDPLRKLSSESSKEDIDGQDMRASESAPQQDGMLSGVKSTARLLARNLLARAEELISSAAAETRAAEKVVLIPPSPNVQFRSASLHSIMESVPPPLKEHSSGLWTPVGSEGFFSPKERTPGLFTGGVEFALGMWHQEPDMPVSGWGWLPPCSGDETDEDQRRATQGIPHGALSGVDATGRDGLQNRALGDSGGFQSPHNARPEDIFMARKGTGICLTFSQGGALYEAVDRVAGWIPEDLASYDVLNKSGMSWSVEKPKQGQWEEGVRMQETPTAVGVAAKEGDVECMGCLALSEQLENLEASLRKGSDAWWERVRGVVHFMQKHASEGAEGQAGDKGDDRAKALQTLCLALADSRRPTASGDVVGMMQERVGGDMKLADAVVEALMAYDDEIWRHMQVRSALERALNELMASSVG